MSYEELVQKTDAIISELVVEKTHLQKAYNYYNCKRDEEQFKYLEENYGIGQPTEVEFIPLIKKHVDALIGEYLDIPIQPKVSCKDTKTINNIFRDKQLKIAEECAKLLKQNLQNNLIRFIEGKNMQDLNNLWCRSVNRWVGTCIRKTSTRQYMPVRRASASRWPHVNIGTIGSKD